MLKRNTVLLALSLVLSGACCGAQGLAGQQVESARPVYAGIIVSRTEAEAQAVLDQLHTGFDFGVLARERSIDQSAIDGGYLGELNSARVSPAMREALKGLRTGEFTGIVTLPNGFAVLALLAAQKPSDLNAKQIQDLVTRSVVRQNINVAGLSEEDALFEEFAKPGDWKQNLKQPCAIRGQAHDAAVKRLEQVLTPGASGASNTPLERMRSYVALAELHTFRGELDKSIAAWKSAYAIAQSSVPGAVPYLQEALGVSYLHRSEMENGVYRDSGTSDIFPPIGAGKAYEKPQDSRTAIQYLSQFLDHAPNDLQARWLLNLAYLTLNEYPAQVPLKYLIAPSVFASKQDIGRFTDVAREAGLNVFSAAGGVIVDDFDNDGLLDIVSSSQDVCDPLHYFHNNGDGTFTDRSIQAGLAGQLGGLNIVQADYNNDGCMDILVLRGGWEFPFRKSLLRNNCDGTFTDVTEQSGLASTPGPTQTAAWADIDNDGYLDLFVANENAPSQLFRNKGDGTFEDISHAAGIDKIAYSKGVVAADYDKDGFVDFYVSNFEGANFLYRNNHDRTFTEIARQAGVQAPYLSFATWFFDYDNDGWPDLFVTSYYSFTDDQILRSYLGLPVSAETMKLYRNLHNGAFEDVTAKVGLDKVFMPMGANFGDIDNDGFLDLYLGMGSPSFATMLPHTLLRNDAGKAFVDITASSGTGELHKGHGIAFADLERNGQEDIVAEIGGAVPADKHTMRVFRNPGHDNDWINVRLIGVKSNRAAVGAEIEITVQDDSGLNRTIYRTVGDTSSFGSNPMEQHIGLGHGARIVSIDVWWPATNTRQKFTSVEKNQFIRITEFETGYAKLKRKSVPLGSANARAEEVKR
jgi:tetratricopeptide (TPR) repeat protein